MGPIPTLPVPGRGPNTVEPTASALRWDAAVNRGILPMKVPSSVASSAAASLPGMKAVSISSSADRRRELLQERHHELQAQLALVEEMLAQAKPSTMMTTMSGFSAVSKKSAKSNASRRSDASATPSGVMSLAAPAATALLSSVPEEGFELRRLPPSQSSKSRVPLMLDPNDASYYASTPFQSVAGTGYALPGAKLSSVG